MGLIDLKMRISNKTMFVKGYNVRNSSLIIDNKWSRWFLDQLLANNMNKNWKSE